MHDYKQANKWTKKESWCEMFVPAELNSRDEEGNTPLHWAVQKDQPRSCSTLLSLGADPNILNNSHQSPLHLAVSLGNNVLVEVSPPFFSTIFHVFSIWETLYLPSRWRWCNSFVFTQQLVSHKLTDVNLEGDLGSTPLILAACLNNHEALEILVSWCWKY